MAGTQWSIASGMTLCINIRFTSSDEKLNDIKMTKSKYKVNMQVSPTCGCVMQGSPTVCICMGYVGICLFYEILGDLSMAEFRSL